MALNCLMLLKQLHITALIGSLIDKSEHNKTPRSRTWSLAMTATPPTEKEGHGRVPIHLAKEQYMSLILVSKSQQCSTLGDQSEHLILQN